VAGGDSLRRSGLLFFVSFVSLVLLAFLSGDAVATWAAQLSAPAANAGARAPSQNQTAPSAPQIIAAKSQISGQFTHTAKRGESVGSLVHIYLPQTTYMTAAELTSAIREANGTRGNTIRPGQEVVIPGFETAPILEKPIAVGWDFEVRAVYLTGAMASSERGLRIINRWRQMGGNSVVFDIKDSDGVVNIPFQHPLNPPGRRPVIRNLPKLARYLHSLGMHSIARVAIFRDERLVKNFPDLAVHSARTGQPWREKGKLVWTDPSRPEVQQYNIALAAAAAKSGVDEVQFDYVRFPAEGDQKDARFLFLTERPQWKRSDVITHFLSKAYAQMHSQGVLLSLDVFGVMAWQRPIDLSHIGQDIPSMALYCDVLSPMIYPSHFFGMDGYAHPGDAPEHFIGESMERFRKITTGSGVLLRPWLQAFAWRTHTYSADYIVRQVKVARDKGGVGFLFWNARNDYGKPMVAMQTMESTPGRYFRGDEVGSAARAAAEKPATPVLRPANATQPQ